MAIINTGYVLCSIARFDCCRVFEVMTIACICLYGGGSKIETQKQNGLHSKDVKMTNKSLYRKCVSGTFASDQLKGLFKIFDKIWFYLGKCYRFVVVHLWKPLTGDFCTFQQFRNFLEGLSISFLLGFMFASDRRLDSNSMHLYKLNEH